MQDTRPQTALEKPDSAPPPFVLRLVIRLRNFLFRWTDRLVPARIALFERTAGFFNLYAMYAAARLGIADLLADGPKSPADLARATDSKPEYLARLLRMLASIGIFELLPDGRFRQNRLSETLRTDTPGSMRPLVMFTGSPVHLQAWMRFFENVKNGENAFQAAHGTSLFEYLGAHPDLGAHFNAAMVSLTRIDAPALAAAYDFRGKKVCDVAGGHGTLLATILARHRDARGVLFDEAHVIAGAPPLLSRFGVEGRCELAAGSFFEKVPPDCDVYILKDILHDWDDEKATAIVKTLRASMKPGARLLVAEMVVDCEQERFPGNFLDLEMMAITNDGKQRSEEQFRALFERAGLRFVRIIPAASPTSFVEAVAT